MMTGNAMCPLLLVAGQLNYGLTYQQEADTPVQSGLIVTLNVGGRMMLGSAIRNVQLTGSVFLQGIDTHVQLQLIDP